MNFLKFITTLAIAVMAVSQTFGLPIVTTSADLPEIGQEWAVMLGVTLTIQEDSYGQYCHQVSKSLMGVDELTDPMERCAKFSENNVKMTEIREPTLIDESVPVTKDVMQTIYKDLHYYEEVLYDMAESGTKSLEHVGCMVDDISMTGPCALYCYSTRRPEQEVYCRMLDQVAPRLKDVLDHMTGELDMSAWHSPPFVSLGLTAGSSTQLVRYTGVLVNHYLTRQLEIAKEAASKYVG